MKKMILFLLVLLMTAATGTWAQTTHTVKMKSGTKDAANWTIATGSGDNVRSATGDATEGLTGVAKGDEVRLTYSGRLKVKSVTATHDGIILDLSNIPASLIGSDGNTFIVPDGATLTGTLDVATKPYKIVIPDGAEVTLADVTIAGTNVDDDAHRHAGIECAGNATIILADNTTNTVKGFYRNYPGIYIAEGKTLTIKGEALGTGSLTASPYDGGGTDYSYSAGIGGGRLISCGNILIEGGVITAQGGSSSAGIGGGPGYLDELCRCGNITITGGTVKASGGMGGAGIGGGSKSNCGDILISGGTVDATGGYSAAAIGNGNFDSGCGTVTITKDVTIVTATMGTGAPNSIGFGDRSSCGTVTIGGTVYYDGVAYQNGGATYLKQKPLTLVNLGKLTGNYEATNGTTLFGTLKGSEQPYKVSIANNATVTLDGVDIEGVNDDNCKWAGLNCAGTATIILKDGSENTVKGFFKYYPGIFVPDGKYLTIKGGTLGNGKLTASPFDVGSNINSYGAGIGGGYEIPCGHIYIMGGEIMAIGGFWSAGIGSGTQTHNGVIFINGGIITALGGEYSAGIGCGNNSIGSYIDITGGTIEAIGGDGAPGIGSGVSGSRVSSCDEIIITKDVKSVKATKGENSPNSIGKGIAGSCGSVIIGCTLDDDYTPIGGTVYDNGIGDSPFTYQPSH